MLVAGTSGADVVAQTPGMAFPKEPVGANAAIRTVEIDPSVSVDGVTDAEEIKRRQVRSLNRQGAAMLTAATERADAIQRNYKEAIARSRIEEKLHQDALARAQRGDGGLAASERRTHSAIVVPDHAVWPPGLRQHRPDLRRAI